ncbi:AAA family ATPase [Oenococcus oeni]|uniref:AAA family ATPase n=1 Tax=Oenococcus oeni TaxID=1247 RepID=UPI003EE556BD
MILPKNEVNPHIVDEPHNFMIWGKPMSGKSYLAGLFPAPLFLNTDSNAKANRYPFISLKNEYGKDGKITKDITDQLDEIITALTTEKHDYQTVIVDVIDDVVALIEEAVCNESGVKALSDIPYGKGYATEKTALQRFVTRLRTMPLNVIYVSREITMTDADGSNPVPQPSLPEKWQNIVNGNSDLVIRTRKIGERYLQQVTEQRKHYKQSRIESERVLKILKYIDYNFAKEEK